VKMTNHCRSLLIANCHCPLPISLFSVLQLSKNPTLTDGGRKGEFDFNFKLNLDFEIQNERLSLLKHVQSREICPIN
jgi:hypothetical protein